MLEMKNVTKKFGRKEVLHHISANLEKGTYALLGANGAGKTTLLRCLVGLYDVQQGEVLWNHKAIKKAEVRLGYLPQKFEGIRDLTVGECLEYFSDLKNMNLKNIEEEISRVLELVNLKEKENTKIKKLSGGMLRRVGIAQALLGNPELLIFDEPTTGLDPQERLRFKNLITGLEKEKIVIISTHIVEDIETLCDYILVLDQGNLLGVLTTEEIRQQAEHKVYEILPEDVKKIVGKYQVIREYQKEDQVKWRILTNENQEFPEQKPTVEDGYLCMILKFN